MRDRKQGEAHKGQAAKQFNDLTGRRLLCKIFPNWQAERKLPFTSLHLNRHGHDPPIAAKELSFATLSSLLDFPLNARRP